MSLKQQISRRVNESFRPTVLQILGGDAGHLTPKVGDFLLWSNKLVVNAESMLVHDGDSS